MSKYTPELLFSLSALILTLIFSVGYYKLSQEETRLMSQCILDGHKEYECSAMIKSGGRLTPYSLIISH